MGTLSPLSPPDCWVARNFLLRNSVKLFLGGLFTFLPTEVHAHALAGSSRSTCTSKDCLGSEPILVWVPSVGYINMLNESTNRGVQAKVWRVHTKNWSPRVVQSFFFEVALAQQQLLIAQRCFAALGDISRVKMLAEMIQIADEASTMNDGDGIQNYKVGS